ncbi:Uncharacterized protein Fot_02302 [Forsythia ovata]|uniref:DUF7788 domain-containing protein n=1 Tax=Forsythia ovata TaxID=205694 RepID=A0ABD1X6G2_9LAMI
MRILPRHTDPHLLRPVKRMRSDSLHLALWFVYRRAIDKVISHKRDMRSYRLDETLCVLWQCTFILAKRFVKVAGNGVPSQTRHARRKLAVTSPESDHRRKASDKESQKAPNDEPCLKKKLKLLAAKTSRHPILAAVRAPTKFSMTDNWLVGFATNGVVLVSGFSKNLLTLFLEEGGIIKRNLASQDVKAKSSSGEMNPEAVMEAAVSGESCREGWGRGRK